MAVQVKVRFLSSVPPPVPLMLVKVATLVLVMFERITALGGLLSGYVHCQLNLPSPATVQERVRLSALVLTGKGTGRREGATGLDVTMFITKLVHNSLVYFVMDKPEGKLRHISVSLSTSQSTSVFSKSNWREKDVERGSVGLNETLRCTLSSRVISSFPVI